MLKTATLQEVSSRQITKRQGHLVVTTRYYPRNLPRPLIHEYVSDLAPTRELLADFKKTAKKLGHDQAFKDVAYIRRFIIINKGLYELKRLSELSQTKDIYLTCYCNHGLYCHRDLLLVMAESLFGAKIDRIKKSYGGFDPVRASTPLEPTAAES